MIPVEATCGQVAKWSYQSLHITRACVRVNGDRWAASRQVPPPTKMPGTECRAVGRELAIPAGEVDIATHGSPDHDGPAERRSERLSHKRAGRDTSVGLALDLPDRDIHPDHGNGYDDEEQA